MKPQNRTLLFTERAADDVRSHPRHLKEPVLLALDRLKSADLPADAHRIIALDGRQFYEYQAQALNHPVKVYFDVKPSGDIVVERFIVD